MENDIIAISAADQAFITDILSSGQNYYQAYDRMLPYLEPGTDRYFWFQQASIINQQATGTQPPSNNNLSSTYIIAHSGYGLALDGQNNDLGVTSNAIAQAVIGDIITNNGIIPLDQMLANDISAALTAGNQTIGGWGGSFYYWDLPYNGSTVGAQILSSPQDLEKFLFASAAATVAVLYQEGNETPTFSEIQTVLTTALGSSLPIELKEEIGLLVVDAIVYGQFVADPGQIGKWTYDPVNDEFFYIIPDGAAGAGDRVVATGEEAQFLSDRFDYRLSIEVAGLDYTVEVLARLGLVNLIPEDQLCFLAGTQIKMFDGTKKPIEDIKANDVVMSYDKAGDLVAGQVKRTFRNTAKAVLDVHGLMVTPGHVTLCGDGKHTGRHVPIIDILRTDGALVREDGSLVRAATGADVGGADDIPVKVVVGALNAQKNGHLRTGTRLFLPNDEAVTLRELIEDTGATVDADGTILGANGVRVDAVHLEFLDAVPKPEDYVLRRSGLTADSIKETGPRQRLPLQHAISASSRLV